MAFLLRAAAFLLRPTDQLALSAGASSSAALQLCAASFSRSAARQPSQRLACAAAESGRAATAASYAATASARRSTYSSRLPRRR